ncbi:MAG: hypothetical protein HKL88_00450 [Bacteroidia bacterium]|nr:hypothetical protein [Bacteroidia bacterium]
MKTRFVHRVIYPVLFCFSTLNAIAQTPDDAFRYSSLSTDGTARFMAMGGAFTAVGGDMGALTFNPAGLGVFIKSQFCFTPGFTMENVNSSYNGTSMVGQQSAMAVQNLGWVGSWRNRKDGALWKNINFAIVYNRTNDFNANYTISGNSKNSMLDAFVNNANGTDSANLDPFSTSQALYTGLINTIPGSNGTQYQNVVDAFLNNGQTMNQQDIISNSGSMGETDISIGSNYNDKLDIGASFGIADIRFSQINSYTETPNYNDTLYGLQNFNYTTTLNTTGFGFNFKIGAIYRITDWLRAGAAVHTPTWFNLTDNYTGLITATYNNTNYFPTGAGTYYGTQNGSTMNGSYNYTLTTPMRAMGGLAAIIHHQAIISADYEWVNYSLSQFAPSTDLYVVNQAIITTYAPQSNIRVGAELVLFPFSLRAGYQYFTNPYAAGAGNASLKQCFSAGAGIKFGRCFLDLAYMLTEYNESYFLYDPAIANAATNNVALSSVACTFGVNF